MWNEGHPDDLDNCNKGRCNGDLSIMVYFLFFILIMFIHMYEKYLQSLTTKLYVVD